MSRSVSISATPATQAAREIGITFQGLRDLCERSAVVKLFEHNGRLHLLDAHLEIIILARSVLGLAPHERRPRRSCHGDQKERVASVCG
jgi:hypothetical protein